MKQIEDFAPYKVTFSSVKFCALVMLMFFAWGYHEGAGEKAGTFSLLVLFGLFVATFFYPLHTLWLHYYSMHIAKKKYWCFAQGLDVSSLKKMLADPMLRATTKQIIKSVLKEKDHHDA